MNKEMMSMTNEEMFAAIMRRMDTMESGITNLAVRMDKVESGIDKLTVRMDTLETNINMEFWAVRTEMDNLDRALKQDIAVLNNKVDRIMFSKDIEGYERMKMRVEVLEKGYLGLREKIS